MADNNDNDNNSASDASLIQYHPLLLDVNGDDDDTDTLHITMQPRRLLPIDATNEIIVYGGTGSSVRQIVSNNNNKDDNDGKDDDVAATGTSSTTLSSLIRHWNDDECVKAIGISSDGTNIVMANDLWEIKLYTYSNPMDCHPFCVPKTTPATVKLMDTFDAPIRDIQFYPNNNNFVAIASEGGMGILNLQDYGTQKIKYLWEQVEEYHNSGGIRSIAFHQIQSTIPKTKDVVTTTILASVSMDGRLCLWNVSDIEKPETWKLIHRETNKCIPKNDVGEIFDADPWDQSCRPVFLSIPSNNNNSGTTVLALPGMTYLQLRRINVVYDNGDNSPTITMEPFDQPNIFDSSTTTNNTVVKGHFEPIVAITTCTDNKNDSSYVVTSGRDNRIVAWSIQQRRSDGSIKAKFIQQICQLDSTPTHMLWQTKGKIDSNNKENSTEGGDKLFIVTADGYLVVINGRENIIPKSNLVVVTSSANEEKNQNQKQNKEDEIIVDHRKKSFGNDSTNNVSASETNSSGTRKNVRFEGDDRDNTKSNDQEQKKVILKKQLKKSKVSETNNDFDSSDDDDDVAMNHDDDDDTDRNDSPPKVKKSRFIDDEAEDDDDEDDISNNNSAMELNNDSTKATPSNGGEDDDIENAIQYEDIDKPSLRHITAPADDNDIDNASDDDASDDSYDRRHQNRRSTNSIVNLPEPQAPFGVSSTPLDLPRRFLCWNHIGSITLLRGDDSTTSSTNRTTIDIHFTNSFSRRNITFTDNLGFILGSLGEDGAIFATDVADDDNDEEDDILGDSYLRGLSKKTKEAVKRDQRTKKNLAKPTGSTLYFNRFETFGNVRDKDWVLTLPSGERVVGCACGEGWAAAITSRRFLRFFSSGGNQGHVLWLPGEPVTIVGRGRFVAVLYHASEPLRDGTQQLGYMLFDGSVAQIIAKGYVSSISNASLLLWAGFSNDGSLTTMDGGGMVSMLVCSSQYSSTEPNTGGMHWEWMPMLDTVGLKKSSDDTFWPISVFDGKLVCVPLKGGTKFPDATRRPVTTALTFRMPLAGTAMSKGGLDELSLRAGIALHQKKVLDGLMFGEDVDSEQEYLALSAQVDKVTLKMFASIIEAGKLERALDLVERLHLEKSFDLAMTIADNHRKLVSLIEQVKERKFPDQASDDEEPGDDYDDESVVRTHNHGGKRVSPDSTQKSRAPFGEVVHRNVRQKQM